MTAMTTDASRQITRTIIIAIQNVGSSRTPSRMAGALLDDRLAERDRDRVRARVRLELADHALGVRLDGLDRQADAARDLLGVEALGQELEDLALTLRQRLVRRARVCHEQSGGQRRVDERL